MAMYQSQPRRKEWHEQDMPETRTYSIAQIVFMDGTTQEFMVKASPTVVPHLLKEMKNTGYLTLWNDTDTLCIRADHVKQITMREVTTK